MTPDQLELIDNIAQSIFDADYNEEIGTSDYDFIFALIDREQWEPLTEKENARVNAIAKRVFDQ